MYERFNGNLCLVSAWIYSEEGVMSMPNYKAMIRRNRIRQARKGGNGRTALIEWNSIPMPWQDKIAAILGDPLEVLPVNYFLREMERDNEAYKYYNEYRTPEGQALPEKKKLEYAANAAVLNNVQKVMNHRILKRRSQAGSTRDIWAVMAADVHSLSKADWPHRIPKNVRRLREKYKHYIKEGYDSLIHAGYGNKNSEKINYDAGMWFIARWADNINKVANVRQLKTEYNSIAASKGWEKIKSAQSIYDFLHKEEYKSLWYGHRYGDAKAKEKYRRQFSTKLPTMREALWESDGTKLNYYYRAAKDGKMKMTTCKVYEVLDVYSEVLLGYHISHSEDFKAQYSAYKMALEFARASAL